MTPPLAKFIEEAEARDEYERVTAGDLPAALALLRVVAPLSAIIHMDEGLAREAALGILGKAWDAAVAKLEDK